MRTLTSESKGGTSSHTVSEFQIQDLSLFCFLCILLLSLLLIMFFWDGVSLCCPGYSRTNYSRIAMVLHTLLFLCFPSAEIITVCHQVQLYIQDLNHGFCSLLCGSIQNYRNRCYLYPNCSISYFLFWSILPVSLNSSPIHSPFPLT